MNRSQLLMTVIGLLVLPSCVDELNITTETALRTLVVEGFISTEPAAHEIKLSTSAKYGSVFEDFPKKVERAKVRIRDDQGNQVFLTEFSPGSYLTPPGFQAEVGKAYTLLVTLADGSRFSSLPERVLPAPPIDTLLTVYKEIPTSNPVVFDHGVEIYAQWDDPASEQNFYWWQNSGTYLIETNPELYVAIDPASGVSFPDPKDCCAVCWVDETQGDPGLYLFSDLNNDGSRLTRLAAVIMDDGGRYDDKYLVRIKQYALTKDAHSFLRLLEEQLSIDGGIFDPPPAIIRGNMLDLDNPEEEPIGYFFAADFSIDSVFIEKTSLLGRAPNLEIFDDCRILENSTDKRPDYW